MIRIILLLSLINICHLKSLSEPVQSLSDAVGHLRKLGYMRKGDSIQADEFLEALKLYQRTFDLDETGYLDSDTIDTMNRPRCGFPDILRTHRKKRFVVSKHSWTTPIITWNLLNYTSDLSEEDQIKAFEFAFERWTLDSNLFFYRSQSKPDILIYYTEIDGENGILATADLPIYPNHDTTLRMDISEKWTNDDSGTHLATVAVHEVGHLLGILHSEVPDAIMFALYVFRGQDIKLHVDDIAAMTELYPLDKKCISGDGFVNLKDGSQTRIRNIQIGDIVQVSEGNFSPILTMLDRNDKLTTLFIQISTKTGKSLKLTPKHLIAVQSKLLEKEYIFAERVKEGSKVYIFDNGKEVEDMVVSVEKTIDAGYYAPLTADGTILVNGISISCYAIIDDHNVAHFAVTPLRLFLQTYQMIFKQPFDEEPTYGVHWYGRWSYDYILPFANKLGIITL